jgi:hypothetical protein
MLIVKFHVKLVWSYTGYQEGLQVDSKVKKSHAKGSG